MPSHFLVALRHFHSITTKSDMQTGSDSKLLFLPSIFKGKSHIIGGSRGGDWGSGPPPPGKSQVTMCFLKNTGMDLPQEAQMLLEGGPYGPL